ncbi:unnamed protein product [Symbiodinium sp. KB8]|nr:unnamed protein product [Symbiodinium sp. KB8]
MCVVQSAWFTYFIQVNLIILGVEVDAAAQLSWLGIPSAFHRLNRPGDEPQGFWVANVVIAVLIFVLELLMKLLAHGARQFFCGSERWWNLFDMWLYRTRTLGEAGNGLSCGLARMPQSKC